MKNTGGKSLKDNSCPGPQVQRGAQKCNLINIDVPAEKTDVYKNENRKQQRITQRPNEKCNRGGIALKRYGISDA